MRGRRFTLVFVLLMSAAAAGSQSPATKGTPAPATASLVDFEGLYDYRDGLTLFILADGDRLFAIISEAKYSLRAAGTDVFTNGSGDRIPFLRDSSGRVTAFMERGDTFRRRSGIVPPEVRTLTEPRPRLGGKPLAYAFAHPPPLGDGIRTSATVPGGFSPELGARLVNGVIDGSYPDVHSILIYHQHALRLEEYFYGYDRQRPHQMRSLTKSVIALLAGIAVDRGLVRADEPALARLGYAGYESPDPRKARITLTDLLSNQSGLACDDHDGQSPGNEVKLYETADWPKAFVDLPMLADPGTVGRYCSGGFFTIGRIIERAAGKPLPEFADEVLFAPLGVRRDHWQWKFTLDRSQRNEFGQVYLRPRDMLKLGILIEQRGVWQERRIVSASWIQKAIAKQSRVDDSDYGLGIWHRWYRVQTQSGEQRVDTIMLSGNGGQKVYIVPSLQLIVVFTGGAYNVESPVNDMMARVLLPTLLDGQEAARKHALLALNDPVAALRTHVERLTGKDPLDCGPLQRARLPSTDAQRVDIEAIERALACARDAAARRRPFVAHIGMYGVDSWVGTGVLGTADGTMMTFSFDSMPCGGPGCPSSFKPRSCRQPAVSTINRTYPGFGCADAAERR